MQTVFTEILDDEIFGIVTVLNKHVSMEKIIMSTRISPKDNRRVVLFDFGCRYPKDTIIYRFVKEYFDDNGEILIENTEYPRYISQKIIDIADYILASNANIIEE